MNPASAMRQRSSSSLVLLRQPAEATTFSSIMVEPMSLAPKWSAT